MTQAIGVRLAPSVSMPDRLSATGIQLALRPLQLLAASPPTLVILALAAMLLRPPDVAFYEIDRWMFGLLVLGVLTRAVAHRQVVSGTTKASWPMLGLTLLSVASVSGQNFDAQAWSLIAAKFIVPFTLFHLAGFVFASEKSLRQFETFALIALAYLCFTAIAFLAGATSLIFPRFILDPSLGYHADRARGPMLQAVANGVSINLLALLALHAFSRGRLKGLKALLLLAAIPVAILATMTRAVWLSFVGMSIVLALSSHDRRIRCASRAVCVCGLFSVLLLLSFPAPRNALRDRLRESDPVAFRQSVYRGSWQMFLERPLAGWGVNQMPSELARHVRGYGEKELYPHNTYLELLTEHGILGFLLYAWLIWKLWTLRRGAAPHSDRNGFLNQNLRALWPLMLAVYLVNASLVVMNYQFVNGLLFTIAGLLAAQNKQAEEAPSRLRRIGTSELKC
ncbi:MAG TPA: O-antigen ligase family protein [Candidatus Sulfotelmatobacter sp.]|nr:O-antigen ligase family protein [Candidatus Sulfotelmatobacter sp.]